MKNNNLSVIPELRLCPMGIPGEGAIDCGSPVPIDHNPNDGIVPIETDSKKNLIIVSAIILGIIFLAK
jgi:hypothetical protein